MAGRSGSEPVKPRNRPPAWNGLRECWECRAGGHSAKANVGIEVLENIDVGLPVVGEDGMSGRNVQRKLGTTRGSPRRSRTAKASRISRYAVKSRCAREWGGWGRLSDDGPGQNNPDPSEGPWGGGLVTHHGGALSSPRPGTVWDDRRDHEMHEGRTQTGCQTAHAGSRLKPLIARKAPLGKPALQPYWGKPAVRNDRGVRGNVGIIRSPIRASILPDHKISETWKIPAGLLVRPYKIERPA